MRRGGGTRFWRGVTVSEEMMGELQPRGRDDSPGSLVVVDLEGFNFWV